MCKMMEDMCNESLQEGIRQGLTEGLRATALRMLEAGEYTLEQIAQISTLSLEEVRQLREDPSC